MTEKPLRIIPWLAVSSLAQAGDDKESLPKQLSDILEDPLFATADVVDTINIPGHSRAYTNFDRFVAGCRVDGITDPYRMYAHFVKQDFDVLVVRDGTRLGREWGIFGELVQLVINAGARIYVQNGFGWVDSSNIDAFIMTNAYAATKQIKDLVRYHEMGMTAKAARGGKLGNKPPPFYVETRDPVNNKPKGIKPDRERYQRFFDDFVTAYCTERIAYENLGQYLYEQFGHVNAKTNRPYTKYVFFRMLFNSATWGHSAYGRYRIKRLSIKEPRFGYWITGDEPAPDGVKFFPNTVEPIWASPTLERVKAEFHHRHYNLRGRMVNRTKYMFSGICVCGVCGGNMSASTNHLGTIYYRCSRRYGGRRSDCDNKEVIPQSELIDWLTPLLDRWRAGIEAPAPMIPADMSAQLDSLDQEISEAKREIRRLSNQVGRVGSVTDEILQDEMKAHEQRVSTLLSRRAAIVSADSSSYQQTVDLAEALTDLQQTSMEDFWKRETFTVNQSLFRLLGNTRIEISHRDTVKLVSRGS